MESVDGKMTQEEYTEIRNKIIDLELRSSIDKVDRSKEIKELKKSIGEVNNVSQTRPDFADSPYFVAEPGNWHLKDGAPVEVQKEFAEYMKDTETPEKTPLFKE